MPQVFITKPESPAFKRSEEARRMYLEGIERKEIARRLGVSRQMVSYYILGVPKEPKINFDLCTLARIRDQGICSLCGTSTYKVRVIDLNKPITLDNIGLLCGDCSRQLSHARRRKNLSTHMCIMPGCENMITGPKRYCCVEHKNAMHLHRVIMRQRKREALVEKKCNKCGVVKTRADFYVHHKQHGIDILYGRCKACHNELTSARNRMIRENKDSPEYKRYRMMQDAATRRYQQRRKQKVAEQAQKPEIQDILARLRGML